MSKYTFYHYMNGEHEEEEALTYPSGQVILQGDYYHNKISYLIEGFITGIMHVVGDENVIVEEIVIYKDNPLFHKLGFYFEENDLDIDVDDE